MLKLCELKIFQKWLKLIQTLLRLSGHIFALIQQGGLSANICSGLRTVHWISGPPADCLLTDKVPVFFQILAFFFLVQFYPVLGHRHGLDLTQRRKYLFFYYYIYKKATSILPVSMICLIPT